MHVNSGDHWIYRNFLARPKFIAEQIMAIGSQLSLFATGKFLDFRDFKLWPQRTILIRIKEYRNRSIDLWGWISILLYIRLSWNNDSHVLNSHMPSNLHILSHLILQEPIRNRYHHPYFAEESENLRNDLPNGNISLESCRAGICTRVLLKIRSVNCHIAFQWNLTCPWQNQFMKDLECQERARVSFWGTEAEWSYPLG